ncbi:MAG TPA: bifunctional diaminohydroxyphosphoribosylaminopyrimidine deaminase/5-amino-6-(5-phosphoribosylamino)uracil reductase RibD [Bacillota bacterium]|nr:bifunctional diaminohydroxyphosphoribosylaminopyrimidine deaminase/5-amino-6-(5-phosphoribosylamino)uracil reductase RibD [Bacillota bacterium]
MASKHRSEDNRYMRLALQLAAMGRGRTSPNPMVGAVVVKDNQIIGEGYHQKAGTPHAEVHALKAAGKEAKGATIYVTLEPCSHHGRTPPCADAIIKAGITKVVAAMTDPNPMVAGRGLKKLEQAGIEVVCGVLEKEARRLNEVFLKYIVTRRPFVLMKAAMTLDGKIATHNGDSRWVTGESARTYVHQLRDEYDAILVGIGTVLSDNPALTTRLVDRSGHDPVRIIVDSEGRLPLEAQVLTVKSDSPTVVAVTSRAQAEKLQLLEAAGAKILIVNQRPDGRVDLAHLMELLGQRNISSVLIEGGAQINAAALEAGIVDKVAMFIAPKIIGGENAPGPVGGSGISRMHDALPLEDVRIQHFGRDIMIEGNITEGARSCSQES